MRSVYGNLKVAGAFLLLVSLFLPFSSCQSYVDEHGRTIGHSERLTHRPLPPGIRLVKTYKYVYRSLDPKAPVDWLVLAGFIWPGFMIVSLSRLKGRGRVAGRFLEAPLLIGSVIALSFETLMVYTTLEIGAYVAQAGLGAYGLGAVWADVVAFHRWKSARATRTLEHEHPAVTNESP